MHEFAEHPEVTYGLTTMCVGLGQGGAVVWENLQGNGGKP
jgi:acetyl-CoA acyltransferase